MPAITKLRQRHNRRIDNNRLQEIVNSGLNTYLQIIKDLKSQNREDVHEKILIVGAGLAGLHAAWLLSKLGYKVRILEATNRIGGRVHSLYNFSKNRIVESGAELIGLNHPSWLYLAKYFGLSLCDLTTEDKFSAMGLEMPILIDGKKLDNEEVKAIEEELNDILMKISKDAEQIAYPSHPWLESDEIKALDQVSLADKLDEWGVEGLARTVMNIQFENDNVAPLNKQSYLGILCQVKGGSLHNNTEEFWDVCEVFRCANGNQALAHKFAEGIKKRGGKIKLNTPVKKILKSENGVLVKTRHHKYNADYVILTAPPSVWHRIQFDPKFNPRKYSPPMGQAIKFLSVVDNRFWIQEGISPTGLNNQLGEIWESSDSQYFIPGQGIGITVFAGGSFAEKALALKSESKMKERFKEGLQKSFNKRFLDHFKSSKMSLHSTDKYIQTGYSYHGIGSIGKLELLNQPCAEYDNRLIFGGEYISTIFPGYMEGAIVSGATAVQQIVDQLTSEAGEQIHLMKNLPLPEIIIQTPQIHQ